MYTELERKKLNEKLFDVMSHQIGVMAEWGDDEEGLREEIETADDEILRCYIEEFLEA